MTQQENQTANESLDTLVAELKAAANGWAQTSNQDRVALLSQVKDAVLKVAPKWAEVATQQKLIPDGSPLIGEEWLSGPYTVMAGCNGLMHTISMMEDKNFLTKIPLREATTGQTVARLVPESIWDYLLLSGIHAEVWMQKDVTLTNLAQHTAGAYNTAPADRKGKVALVLGAGNIAAITPLDCFQKLFLEHQVVILKMNPLNDYLTEFFEVAMKPLIDVGALRIVKGDADVGGYLCNHPDIEEIHITGSSATHDTIVWGAGSEGEKNKAAGTPQLTKRITSELGAVCPTIVVPGPWSSADLSFQAAQIATQKLHNSGFNCVACQVLVLPEKWNKTETLLSKIEAVTEKAPPRKMYYPGAEQRMADFSAHDDNAVKFERPGSASLLVSSIKGDADADAWFEKNEVFAPAMSTYRISENDPTKYLKEAIKYANEKLHGTLGANILIHPATIRKIGKKQFEALIADLHYGAIAINAWTGLNFLTPRCPWGAYPGHTPDDIQSGHGVVHNTFMFDKVERCVVWAPFRPFPRNLLSLGITLLPKPPWFINNRRQHKIGMLLTHFQHKPSWFKLPRIFLNALLG